MTGVRATGRPRPAAVPHDGGRAHAWVPAATTPTGVASALLAAVFMLLTAAVVLLVPAAPAAAHAALVAATPAPGSVIGASPTEVTVTFSEPVTAVTGKVQVLAPNGKRISGTPTVRGATLHIPVRRADRPLGTYLVSYRVISADSHPVGGGLIFSVGAPSARAPAAPTDEVHRSVSLALPLAHFLGYAGLALAIGPALFLALLWPRRLGRRGPSRLVFAGCVLIAVATLAAIWLQAPYSSGAALWQVSARELGDVLGSTFGATMTARLAVLGIIAALLPPVLRGRAGRDGAGQGRAGRGRAAALMALTVAGLATWPLAGHAVAAPLRAAAVAADVVHLAAMAVWLGGLLTLAIFVLRGTPARVLAVILPAWSRWALLAVIWLVGGGTVQAVLQIGSLGALWGTGYGRLLLGKITILAGVLATAAYARRLVRRGRVSTDGPRLLARTVVVELAATALVLALSAVLVQTAPARQGTGKAVDVAPSGVSQTLTCPLYTLQFNIFPVQLGDNNTVHAFVYTPEGAPLAVKEWKVTTALTGLGLEPVTNRMLGILPHHAIGALTFPLPGTYEVRFTIRTTEIDEATVRTTVTVR